LLEDPHGVSGRFEGFGGPSGRPPNRRSPYGLHHGHVPARLRD
jgi:hypothetical protein